MSDEQLESSLRQMPPPGTSEHSNYKGNASSNVWQLYPLTTVADVRAWQAHTPSPEKPTPRRPHGSDSGSDIDDGDELPEPYADQEGPVAVTVDRGTSTPSRVGYSRGREAIETDTASSPAYAQHIFITSPPVLPDRISHVRGSQAPEGESNTTRESTGGPSPSTTPFLPPGFQDEFLW